MYSRPYTLLYLSLLALLPRIRGDKVNITIDDQYGDPTTGQVIQYNPPQAWQPGQSCDACTAKPRPISNAHNGTWMDSTFNPSGTTTNGVPGQLISASVPFVGTAVYVNVILTGSISSPDGNTDYTFSIDNTTAGVFQRAPDGNTSYSFNQIVFAKTGLENKLHTLTMEAGRAGNKSLVLLDSIIYTKEDNSSTSASSALATNTGEPNSSDSGSETNVGIIVGPIVGGIIVAGAVLALIIFLRRQRREGGQRVKVLIDSPPMGAVSPAYFGSSPSNRGTGAASGFASSSGAGPGDTQRLSGSHIVPYSMPTAYSHSSARGYDAGATRGTPAAAATQSEFSYGSSRSGPSEAAASSQQLMSRPRHNVSAYGEVDESAIDATTPLASPPAYSEVDSNVGASTSVSRLPNPYGKGDRPS